MMSMPHLPESLEEVQTTTRSGFANAASSPKAMDSPATQDTVTSSPPASLSTQTTVAPSSVTVGDCSKSKSFQQQWPQQKSKGRDWLDKPKSSASRARDQRLPSAKTSSVFDRLYKTQTAASRSWMPARQQARKVLNTVTTSTKSEDDQDDDLQIFHRLHISGTVSNTTKRLSQKHPIRRENGMLMNHDMRTPAPSPSKAFTPTKQARSGRLVYSPRMKPKTLLRCFSKYHPGIGFEDVAPISLGYMFFQNYCEYEAGALDGEQLSKEIIRAFFKKDFPSKTRHWVIDEPIVTKVEDPDALHAFSVKMTANYDWDNTVKKAIATAVVKCIPQRWEVLVEDYKCWVG